MDGRVSECITNIKELLITPLVLCMPIANDKFRLESDISKLAAGGSIISFQQGP